MFENTILVLKIEGSIRVYRAESGKFAYMGSVGDGLAAWLAEKGYTRAVAFEDDDAISGLWTKEQAEVEGKA